jgi:hypothetical protein
VRSVLQTEHGGAVAMPNNSDIWPTYYRRKALAMIAAQCPDGYEITDEREVAVGGQGPLGKNDNPRWDYFGGLERAPAETEYQIFFRCKSAAAALEADAHGEDQLPAPRSVGANSGRDNLPR